MNPSNTTLEQLLPADAQAILERLPERIRIALVARAAEINYPIEAIVEMAIASYLDEEALGFADCKPSLWSYAYGGAQPYELMSINTALSPK